MVERLEIVSLLLTWRRKSLQKSEIREQRFYMENIDQ